MLIRHLDVTVKEDEIINISGMRTDSRTPKKILIKTIHKYLNILILTYINDNKIFNIFNSK